MGCKFGLAPLLLAACAALAPLTARAGLQESVDVPLWSAGSAPAAATAADPLQRPAAAVAPDVQAESAVVADAGVGPLTPGLGVWLIVRHSNALREGDAFAALDANLATLALLPSEPPAAVPLPAPAWLLVTGLLGMIGARLSRRGAATGALQARPVAA